MKTIISVIGSDPKINDQMAVKIAGETNSTIFAISDYRFSHSTEPGHPAELSAWKNLTDQVLERDSVVLTGSSLSGNLLKLYQNASFDTKITVLQGDKEDFGLIEKDGLLVYVLNKTTPSRVAEKVQKYLLQDRGF